jgi:hypothetical protein
VQTIVDSMRSLSTGASWSGNERNHLFLGDRSSGDFVRVTGISGADDPGDSRGFALLDFDHDGWQDMLLYNLSEPRIRLLRNKMGTQEPTKTNGFVALQFIGGNHESSSSKTWSSREGFGARVILLLDDGSEIMREHHVEDGYMTQHSATMIVGIGLHASVSKVTVRWPSGREQTLENADSGSLLRVHESKTSSPTGAAFEVRPYVDAARK